MAISPSEAKAAIPCGSAAAMIELEAEIDAYLVSEFRRGNRRPFFDTSALLPGERSAIVAKYRRAGWRVTEGSDRDGPHLIFEEG